MARFFNCRMCAENPLGSLFESSKPRRRESINRSRKSVSRSPKKDAGVRPEDFQVRSSAEIAELIDAVWMRHVHSRAWDAFKTEDNLRDLLRNVATSIPRDADPILGDQRCCLWLGE